MRWLGRGEYDLLNAVAINWDETEVPVGGCKWKRSSHLNEHEVKMLVERAEKVTRATRIGNLFRRNYAVFARAGRVYAPAQALVDEAGAILVDLHFLDTVLADAVR